MRLPRRYGLAMTFCITKFRRLIRVHKKKTKAFATKYASFLGVSEADLHPDKQHIEQFYQARKNREKTNPERYFEDLHSGVRYETEKERQKRVRKEHRKMERQMKKQKR